MVLGWPSGYIVGFEVDPNNELEAPKGTMAGLLVPTLSHGTMWCACCSSLATTNNHVHNVECSMDILQIQLHNSVLLTSRALAGAGSGSFSNSKNGEGSRKAPPV